MATIGELNEQFGLEGVLRFEEHGSEIGVALVRAQVHTPVAEATIYLQGAHLTHWQPAGASPVLFLSSASNFVEGKAIRGGVPVCFPWFGPRWDGGPNGVSSPAHGFARVQPWEVAFAALSGEDLHLSLVLRPTALSRNFGYDGFQVALEFVIGRSLRMRLSVANSGSEPLVFEEALHAYFRVQDVRETRLEGLESAIYLDKTDGMREKQTAADALMLTGETDRVFPENVASPTLLDGDTRKVTIDKSNSATTVVWNPWSEKAASLADLAAESWTEFLCVEAANAGSDRLTLAPGDAHTMQVEVYVSGERVIV